MASKIALQCILCRKEIAPGNRVYLKSGKEPLESVKEVLMTIPGRSEEHIDKFLSGAVCCKAVCSNSLKKLAKIRREMDFMKLDIENRIGALFDSEKDDQTIVLPASSLMNTPSSHATVPRTRLVFDTPVKKALSQPIDPNGSPVVYLVNKKPGAHCRVNVVSRSLKGLGRSVGRRNKRSIVNFVMKDKTMRKAVSVTIGKEIQKEMKHTCLQKEHSIFKDKGISAVGNFNWSNMIADLKRTAPILSSVLENCLQQGEKKTKTEVTMTVAAGVLLQGYSERACLVQRVISLLLYASHSPKQLYTRLQRVGLCVSHRSTIRLVDKLGENFDGEVKEWCNFLLNTRLNKINTIDTAERCSSAEAVSGSEQQPIPVQSEASIYNEETFDFQINELFDNDNMSNTISSVSPPAFSPLTSNSSRSSPPCNESESEEIIAPTATSCKTVKMPTFKIVGDNVDKSVRPREETSDSHLQSLHYFHSYAVLDRCDMSSLDDAPSLCDTTSADVCSVLPTDLDHSTLKQNLTTIVSRILRNHFTFFKDNLPSVQRHIPHIHSKEMSLKSTVVPLGVLPKNEIKNEDMASIMSHLQQYVPVQSKSCRIQDPESEKEMELFEDKFHYLLFGGDQLTVERATGSKEYSCSNEWRGLERLEGLIPVIEDWHAKVCFLKAIWRVLYRTSSGSNSGTLYHLRNVIQRRTVTVEIKSDPTACEEFFLLVVEAHIISLSMKEFGFESADSIPQNLKFSKEQFLDQPPKKRTEVIQKAVSQLIDKCMFTTKLSEQASDKASSKTGKKKMKRNEEEDNVMAYGKEVMTLGLLYMEYCDSIKEGDGLRIIRCWRYMLLLFKMTNKRKYSIQASTLLLQYHFIFTERMRNQLLWSRTINVHGKPGKNIPMDLHMEHLNRELKEGMRHLASNTSEASIIRIGKCLQKLIDFRKNFDKCTDISTVHGHHTTKSKSKDLELLVNELNKMDLFTEQKGRKHSQFPNFEGNIMSKVNKKDLIAWLDKQLLKLVKE